ncbi:hypothetical protein DWG18_11655 [Lysobacter sp. TY2-98]|uniref:hypothetical protein n=1 Tax=Lysobacter sp. TY2-98 TaxID=2290922 RepID=UPI000E20A4EF|nr:hypothetical protein [Lysobacter sp. TY2-98]AXK72870.1 hypothetical protein DWG18_11655 [Lysobacter sp. TY2-98]
MLTRALFVLLLVLNVGVAAWWALHASAPAAPPSSLPGDVPTLELVDAGNAIAAVRTPQAPSSSLRCWRYGPFTNPAAFEAARRAIVSQVAWTATAEQIAGAPRAWRVVLPQPDRATATATAARIGAAGFADYLILPEGGPDANTIALGRYRGETSARDRASALERAGFQARVEPVGGRVVQWLDVAATPAFDARSAALGLTGVTIDCAGVVRDGRYTIPAPA